MNAFVTNTRGVFDFDAAGNPHRLCGPLDVGPVIRNAAGNAVALGLAWHDPDGRAHEWAMPLSLLVRNNAEIRRRLLDGGLYVATGRIERAMLRAYLTDAATRR